MTQTKTRFQTLEEYAALDTSELPECRYELVDGVIVDMGAENDINVLIAGYLFSVLLGFVPYYLIRRGTEIQVESASVTCRDPDLMVITEATDKALNRDKRSLITLDMPNPSLVIEVVSPGEPGSDNYDRDYIDKRSEYAARNIPEYWLIDPSRSVVMVLRLADKAYTVNEFRGSDRLISATFELLEITAEQVLSAGR